MTKVKGEVLDVKKHKLTCKHEDCKNTATTRGFCRRHYQCEYRKLKKDGAFEKAMKRCIIPECLTTAVRWSLCRKHGQRLYYYRNKITEDFCRQCPKDWKKPVYCQHLCKVHYNDECDPYTFELLPDEFEFLIHKKEKPVEKPKKKRKRNKKKRRKRKRKRKNKKRKREETTTTTTEEKTPTTTKNKKRKKKKRSDGLKQIRGSRRKSSRRNPKPLEEILEENEVQRPDTMF